MSYAPVLIAQEARKVIGGGPGSTTSELTE